MAELEFSSLIEALYECADNVADWQHIMDLTRRWCGAKGAHLVMFDPNHPDTLLYSTVVDLLEAPAKEIWEEFGHEDPRAAAIFRNRGQATRCVDIIAPEIYDRTGIVQKFLDPYDMRWTLGGSFIVAPDRVAGFSLLRPRREGWFTEEEAARLAQILPHLTRIGQLQKRLNQLEATVDGLECALERVTNGLCLVTEDGEVLSANSAAEAIWRAADGLALRGRRLAARDAEANKQLQAALKSAASRDFAHTALATLTVPRSSRRPPYVVQVFPLARSRAPLLGRRADAMVVMSELGGNRPSSPDGLLASFRLTPAETRLATAIAAGDRLADLADRFGVTKVTLRSQLLSIFHKTGTSRQAELVALVRQLSSLSLRYSGDGT